MLTLTYKARLARRRSLSFGVMTVFPKEFLRVVAVEYILSPAEQEAFLGVFGSDESVEAISEELGISLTALRVRLSAVYKKFNISDSGPGKLTKLRQVLSSKYDAFVRQNLGRNSVLKAEPSFYLPKEQGNQILQEGSLDWALDHALRFGENELLPPLFEYDAINYDWSTVRQYLLNQNLLEWKVRPYRELLVPKRLHYKYAFRVIIQIDPLDFIIFAALVKELGADIESKRVPIDRNIIFSHRYLPTEEGWLFNEDIGYSQFRAQSKKILEQEPEFTHVLKVDIANFYQNIHLPLLEKALNNASSLSMHVKVLMNLLSSWSSVENFGIPVGSEPAHLLAEIALSNVDDALLAFGVKFIRYVDDYLILATSHTEAYRYFAFLTDVLRINRLDLQAAKTDILTKQDYLQGLFPTLKERLQKLRKELSKGNLMLGSMAINEEKHQFKLKDKVLNYKTIETLVQMFREQLKPDNTPKLEVIIVVLSQLGLIGDDSLVDDVLKPDNLVRLLPAFPDIIKYLSKLEGLSPEDRSRIGVRVLKLVENSIISELEYYRIWALNLFAGSTKWNNEDTLVKLLASDLGTSRRELILSMGRTRQKDWFQSQWNRLLNEPPWSRRALLAGASCLPSDKKEHWYKFVESQLDVLEKAVMKWAMANPF